VDTGALTATGASMDAADTAAADSRELRIQVLNGGYTAGLAGKTRDRLAAAGYNVVDIGDHDGERDNRTIILVRNEGEGGDLRQFFPDSKIKVTDDISSKYDIVIILGLGE
jgi:hypothetical protein